MADGRIIIDIQNFVRVQGSPSSTPRENLNNSTGGNSNSTPDTGDTKESKSKGKFDTLLSTQFLAGTFQKVANATGNEDARRLSSAVGQAVKYGGVAVDLISGNPVSLIATAIELATKALEAWCNEKKQKAEEQNNVDISRINAGLMDISNVKVSENFWGRMTYSNK